MVVGAPTHELGSKPKKPPLRYGKWIYLVDGKNYACATISIKIPNELESFEEVMVSPKKEHWIHVMQEEFDSMMENGNWEYQKLPKGRKIVKNKWVYKLKLATNKSVDRYKVRFVVKGFI